MDIQVVFTDGSQKTLQVRPDSTVGDVTSQATGLSADQLCDYSLAWQNKHSEDLVNIDWLLPWLPLGEQGVEGGSTLVLLKKYFSSSSSSELEHLQEPLVGWLYNQLLHTFVKGLYKCSTFQAAQIAAIACQVEGLSETALQQENGDSLRKVLPKQFMNIKGMDRLVNKASRRMRAQSKEAAQRIFIQRLQRQETFGMAFYTATAEESETRFPVLIGVGPESISKLDRDEMEVLDQWDIADLVKCTFDIQTLFMEFGQEVVTTETSCGHMIHDYVFGMQQQNLTKKHQKDLIGQKMPKMPSPKPPPKPAKKRGKPGSPGVPRKKPVPPPKPAKKLPLLPTKPSHSTSSSPLLQRKNKNDTQASFTRSCGDLQGSEEDQPSPTGSPVSSGGKLSTESGSSGDELSSPSAISRRRGGRNMAIKRRKGSCLPEEEFVPQDYETLYSVVNDTVDEVSRLLGDENWAAHMDCLQEENPVYDQIVASDTETILRSSSVTYRALSETFKQSIKRKEKKTRKKKTSVPSTPPVSPKPSRPPPPPTSPKPERLISTSSDKSKKAGAGITKLSVSKSATDSSSGSPGMDDDAIYSATQETDPEYDYVVIQRGAVKRPIKPPTPPDKPQLTKKESVEPFVSADLPAPPPVQAWKPPLLPKPAVFDRAKPATEDDVFYDDIGVLTKMKKRAPLTAKVSLPNLPLDGSKSTAFSREKTRHFSEKTGPELNKSRAGPRLLNKYKKSESSFTKEAPSAQEMAAPPPKPPRLRQRQQQESLSNRCASEKTVARDRLEGGGVDEPDTTRQQKSRMLKPGEVLQDYVTLQREFRVFFIKLPSGVVHAELANLAVPVRKLIARLCVLLCLEGDPSQYLLFVEGSALTSVKEKESLSEGEDSCEHSAVVKKPVRRTVSPFEHFSQRISFTILPDQGPTPILLNPELAFDEQGITCTRVLALRPKPGHSERVPRIPLRVPDWVRFHQCWLAVVQGNQPCSLQDAIKLAALQYQMYFKDRTEINSIIGFCKSSDFLPLEYARLSGLEEKIFTEQQTLKGLSRQEAQEAYINTCTALPTYGTIFFPCKELKKRVFQGNKLTTVLLGINKEGIMRVDAKTKEILDMWPYPALKNWGNSKSIFLLDFTDRSYPVKTNQAKWMNDLIAFHVNTIMETKQPSPLATNIVLSGRDKAELVLSHYEMDPRIGVEEVYKELFASQEENGFHYNHLTAEEVQRNYHLLTSSSVEAAPPLSNSSAMIERPRGNSYPVLERVEETSEETMGVGRGLNGERKRHVYRMLEESSGAKETNAKEHHYHVLQQRPLQNTANGYDCLHKPRSRRNEDSHAYSVLEQSTNPSHHQYHILERPQLTSTHTYSTPHTSKCKRTHHEYHVLEKPSSHPNSRSSSPTTTAPSQTASLVPPPALFSSQTSVGPYRVTRLATAMEGSDPSHKYQPLVAGPGGGKTGAYNVPQSQLGSGEAIYDEPEFVLSTKVQC